MPVQISSFNLHSWQQKRLRGRKWSELHWFLDEWLTTAKCKPWNGTLPHMYSDVRYFADSVFNPSSSLSDIANKCRNPSLDGVTYDVAPWCYISDDYTQKQYCLVPACRRMYIYFEWDPGIYLKKIIIGGANKFL